MMSAHSRQGDESWGCLSHQPLELGVRARQSSERISWRRATDLSANLVAASTSSGSRRGEAGRDLHQLLRREPA